MKLSVPPLMLSVFPLAPLSEPAVAPHVPAMEVRLMPLTPPVEVTFANVPLTVPVVRLRAVAAETLTELPIVRRSEVRRARDARSPAR